MLPAACPMFTESEHVWFFQQQNLNSLLERCWRCEMAQGAKHRYDDLGLCPECVSVMVQSDT